jgi:hypothetical protein
LWTQQEPVGALLQDEAVQVFDLVNACQLETWISAWVVIFAEVQAANQLRGATPNLKAPVEVAKEPQVDARWLVVTQAEVAAETREPAGYQTSGVWKLAQRNVTVVEQFQSAPTLRFLRKVQLTVEIHYCENSMMKHWELMIAYCQTLPKTFQKEQEQLTMVGVEVAVR